MSGVSRVRSNMLSDEQKSWRQTYLATIIYTLLSGILITTGINILNIWFSFEMYTTNSSFGEHIAKNSLFSEWYLLIGGFAVILTFISAIESIETNQYLIEWHRVLQGSLVISYLITTIIYTLIDIFSVWDYRNKPQIQQWQNTIILGIGTGIGISEMIFQIKDIGNKFVSKNVKNIARNIISITLYLISSFLLLFMLFCTFITIDDDMIVKVMMGIISYFISGVIMLLIFIITDIMGL